MVTTHSFHIPVMGIGYTIDTPLQVAQLGIDSVISLVDDSLIEKIRKYYCQNYALPYQEITNYMEDFRARRITSYLDMIHQQAEKKLNQFRNLASGKIDEVKEYFQLLPEQSTVKQEFSEMLNRSGSLKEMRNWLHDKLSLGSIDVNIMTKVDKTNYKDGQELPVEFNDAHAALRGFAQSTLNSSVVLSAGMNPRLYSYIAQFEDFFATRTGEIKKRIVLKVSDFRSALIQGRLLAKKGLWVSEFRVESGLNCGGHAFASDGYLMGPILAEFRDKRRQLATTLHEALVAALGGTEKPVPEEPLPLKITAQGGVGTAEEHRFLMEEYQVDSVGWGTPFLLVPEVVSIDEDTLCKLEGAGEKDLYLSGISPLGVPFNNLRGNTKDAEKQAAIDRGRPGSPCPKKYVGLNNEFTERGICTASRLYQRKKLEQLKHQDLSETDYQQARDQVLERSCICVGLGTSALLAKGMDTREEGTGVSICPGPNMAYFSKRKSLKEMVDHIYGRSTEMEPQNRPNLFMKELYLYLDYFQKQLAGYSLPMSKEQKKYARGFLKNMGEGIDYYQSLFSGGIDYFRESKAQIEADLSRGIQWFKQLRQQVEEMSHVEVSA
ncbi:MAG: hypothetical protein ACQESW_06820 [Bacteroidota bacterium]